MANHQSLPQHGKPSPTLSLMLKEFTEKNLRRHPKASPSLHQSHTNATPMRPQSHTKAPHVGLSQLRGGAGGSAAAQDAGNHRDSGESNACPAEPVAVLVVIDRK